MGKHQLDIQAEKLANYLQEIHRNFAYKMLVLEIGLHNEGKNMQQKNKTTTEAITTLTQLYMRAVESLEDKYSQGYQFFSFKIQNLLKKRSIVEELLKQTQCSVKDRQTTMKAIQKAEMKDRREEYNIRLSLENPLQSRQRVQEIIKNSELRLNMIESKIKTGIHQQDRKLAQRLKSRKLKSESSTKDPNQWVDGYFEQKDKIQNSEEVQIKKNYAQVKVQKVQKLGPLGLRKKTNPNLFNSFSHIKF